MGSHSCETHGLSSWPWFEAVWTLAGSIHRDACNLWGKTRGFDSPRVERFAAEYAALALDAGLIDPSDAQLVRSIRSLEVMTRLA